MSSFHFLASSFSSLYGIRLSVQQLGGAGNGRESWQTARDEAEHSRALHRRHVGLPRPRGFEVVDAGRRPAVLAASGRTDARRVPRDSATLCELDRASYRQGTALALEQCIPAGHAGKAANGAGRSAAPSSSAPLAAWPLLGYLPDSSELCQMSRFFSRYRSSLVPLTVLSMEIAIQAISAEVVRYSSPTASVLSLCVPPQVCLTLSMFDRRCEYV